MFGYITANLTALPAERTARYRAWYCGLCKALSQRHGAVSRLTLNYDMTFLVMLLSSVYGGEEQTGRERCAAHPLRRHDYLFGEYSLYAADMNVLLAYHNLMDDWQDDRSVMSLAEARLFRKAGRQAAERFPRQAQAILAGLERLGEAEKNGELRPDIPANAFGSIMAELFAFHEDDEHAPHLRDFGMALGRFIYIMDACMDFDSDLRRTRYNPLAAMTGADFEPMLTMLAAECTAAFECLPVTADRDIIENILYSGMWAKYAAKYHSKKKTEHKEVPSEE